MEVYTLRCRIYEQNTDNFNSIFYIVLLAFRIAPGRSTAAVSCANWHSVKVPCWRVLFFLSYILTLSQTLIISITIYAITECINKYAPEIILVIHYCSKTNTEAVLASIHLRVNY